MCVLGCNDRIFYYLLGNLSTSIRTYIYITSFRATIFICSYPLLMCKTKMICCFETTTWVCGTQKYCVGKARFWISQLMAAASVFGRTYAWVSCGSIVYVQIEIRSSAREGFTPAVNPSTIDNFRCGTKYGVYRQWIISMNIYSFPSCTGSK